MLLRVYGSKLQSVDLNFDSKALNEIGFRRDRQVAFDRDAFFDEHERVSLHEFTAEADGYVHDEVETEVLARLETHVRDALTALGESELIVVESEGADYPKTRQTTRNVVVEGENRLHFTVHIDPPLRLGVYRAKA